MFINLYDDKLCFQNAQLLVWLPLERIAAGIWIAQQTLQSASLLTEQKCLSAIVRNIMRRLTVLVYQV